MHSQYVSPTPSASPKNLKRFVVTLLCTAALSGLPLQESKAWGIVGHRIVCEIAFERLLSHTQEEVNSLVQSFKKPNGKKFKDFRDSCAFADTARHNARDGFKRWRHYGHYDRWHYLNVPRDTADLNDSKVSCASECVLHAITFHSDKIRDLNLPKAKRGEAIILLAHWIADIHQPLHVGFSDDHGGSDIKIKSRAHLGKNLHSAWDTGLLKHARGNRKLRIYTRDLSKIRNSDVVAWMGKKDPRKWAAESYSLATSQELGYCQWKKISVSGSKNNAGETLCHKPRGIVNIDKTYITNNTPILEKRLQQAAVRLAARLESLLQKPP